MLASLRCPITWTPTGRARYVVMRRSETVAAGWVLIGAPLDAHAVCSVEQGVCASDIPWRLGLTEIQVFGVYRDGPTGEATPVGDRPAFTFR